MHLRRLLVPTLIVFVVASRVFAQEFQASVDKNPVSVDDQFTLTFALNNAGTNGGRNLKLPNIEKFRIMMGPSTSSNMQIINGAVSSSVSYRYVLQPKEAGKFTIGTATIEAEGKTYSSAPISIEVVKGSSRPKQQQAQSGASASGDVQAQLADNVFLRATVDKSRVMQGEQVNIVYRLYTRVSIQNYNLTKAPSLTGFWSEDAEMPKQIQLTTETIDGKQFQVGLIKRSALFPTQSGSLEIGPMEITTLVTVRDKRSWDPFESFFNDPFGRQVEYIVKSDPVRIKVDPLPAGAPASFKGAVGKFSMNAKVDRQQTKANEPLSLKVTIAGTGNIKVLESPTVSVPTDFEQYTPKVADNINRREAKISGSKTFEYILIPRYPGKKTIKPVEFSYFDLAKREYVTLHSPELDINVEPGVAGAAPFMSSQREDVQLLSQDIRYIKVGRPAFAKQGEYLHTSGVFVALMLAPLAALAGAFVYTRQRKAVMSDAVGYRNRQAMKVARKGLKNAEVLLHQVMSGKDSSSEKKIRFYSELAKSMWNYLGDKLNIQQADISIDNAVNELARRTVNGETSVALKSLLESCEMARFAPTSLSTDAMKSTYNAASKIIVDVERTLKS